MAVVSNFLMSVSLYTLKMTEDRKKLSFIWVMSTGVYHSGNLHSRFKTQEYMSTYSISLKGNDLITYQVAAGTHP